MGIWDTILGGAINFATSAYNQKQQKDENQIQRDFAASQQEDAQEFNALEAQKNRDFQSAEAALTRDFNALEAQKNRDFQSAEAEAAYDRQTEFYEKYQSIGAQMRQYEESGLNPALLAGGVSVGSTPSSSPASGSSASASSASGSMASSGSLGASVASLPGIISLAEGLLSVEQMKAVIQNLKKEGSHIEAETAQIQKNTDWIDKLNIADLKMISSNIDVNSSQVEKNLQSVKESMSNVDLNHSKILVNGADIELKGNQSILSATQSVVNNLTAQKLEKLMPYIEARMEADISYTNAKTNTERYNAEDKMYEANIKMLRGMVEAGLIDKGYYDSMVDEKLWNAKSAKREYKWAPINDICSNVSKLAIAGSSVVSSLSGAGVNIVKDVVAPQVSLGFF